MAKSQAGVALVIVLWVVTLLTVIVSSYVHSARVNTQLTGNWVSRSRSQALADAGVHRGVHELLRPAVDGDRWQADGRMHEFELGDGKIVVTIVDETAYIDINAAPDKLLLGLFLSAGVEVGYAQSLVDAVMDWRDADDLPRTSGAERDQYQVAGLQHVPANANFRTLDELKLVLGMTPALYARLAPAITVYSRMPGINSALAPREVLIALPDANPEEVDDFLALRSEELAAGLQPSSFPPAAAFSSGRSGRLYRFQSKASLPDGTVFVREAVVRLKDGPKSPYGFLSWLEGRP